MKDAFWTQVFRLPMMYLTRTTTTTNQKGSTTNSNSYLKGKKQVARSTNGKHVQEKSPYPHNPEQALYVPLDKWQECKPRQAAPSRLQGNFRAQCCMRERRVSTGSLCSWQDPIVSGHSPTPWTCMQNLLLTVGNWLFPPSSVTHKTPPSRIGFQYHPLFSMTTPFDPAPLWAYPCTLVLGYLYSHSEVFKWTLHFSHHEFFKAQDQDSVILTHAIAQE